MDLTPELIEEIESMLERLEALDPADVPEPAAELVALLGRILSESDEPA
jgi:hypothetical protein